MGDTWGVFLCGWATGMFCASFLMAMARRPPCDQTVHILPPRGGSVMSKGDGK